MEFFGGICLIVNNPIAVLLPYHFNHTGMIRQQGIHSAEIQLIDTNHHSEELKHHLDPLRLQVIAFRSPVPIGTTGDGDKINGIKKLIEEVGRTMSRLTPFFVLHTSPVSINEIFAFLDEHPGDFDALADYKEMWLDRIIHEIYELKDVSAQSGVTLLLENTPIGTMYYFEPGEGKIYPGLRTPHDLIKIHEKTGIDLCFHSGYARISCNVLTYMKRTRSLFAGATEEEVMNASVDWVIFYEKIADRVKLIHLSDSISLGDTPLTRKVPFRKNTWFELERFVSLLPSSVPIVFDFHTYDPKQSRPYKQFLELWKHYRLL